jgi:hypothetical protein
MFLMDRFFDGAFLTFGLEVIAFAEQDQEDRLDPLIYVFPRMTKVPISLGYGQVLVPQSRELSSLALVSWYCWSCYEGKWCCSWCADVRLVEVC